MGMTDATNRCLMGWHLQAERIRAYVTDAESLIGELRIHVLDVRHGSRGDTSKEAIMSSLKAGDPHLPFFFLSIMSVIEHYLRW
jgi:hypothetical protein